MTPRTETRELTEHERLSLIEDKSQAIGDFVEWLAEKGIRLCHEHKHTEDCKDDCGWLACDRNQNEYVQDHTPITKLLAEHFDIDLDKLEIEKRQMLADIRERAASHDIRKEPGLDATNR